MALHIGYLMRGWKGLVVAGLAFLFPAITLTIGFTILYIQFGQIPSVVPLLTGIKPVVIILILGALWKLQEKAVKLSFHYVLGIAVTIVAFLISNPVIVLFLGSVVGTVIGYYLLEFDQSEVEQIQLDSRPAISAFTSWLLIGAILLVSTLIIDSQFVEMGWYFYLIGSILYGSGYVLIAFLEGGLVNQRGWLTADQLLDAIAIGQFTPGPVLSTSSFIGYVILGFTGAIVATLGIFLPSFFFVVILNPIIPRMRSSRLFSSFLDAINVSALALMLAVVIQLSLVVFQQPSLLVIAVVTGIGLFRYRLNSALLVIIGAVLGLLLYILQLI